MSQNTQTDAVGLVFIVPSGNTEYSARTSDYISVFAAELVAIQIAVQWVFQNNIKRALICSNSVSVLTSIKTEVSASYQGLVLDIITEYRKCLGKGLSVGFLWTQCWIAILSCVSLPIRVFSK